MAASHRGIALLIANSSYPHLGDVENALNDASAMSCKLESCDYEILSALNLNTDDIRTKISHLKRRLAVSQHCEILIYYAGHGLVHNNEHYIAGGEFNKEAQLLDDEISLNCLSVDSDIIDEICEIQVSKEKTRSFVVILDACREFIIPLHRGMTSGGALFPPLKQRLETKIGVLVCYAYALGSKVRDSGKHGLYTDCILQNIFEPGKSIFDAISLANRMAAKRANGDQRSVLQVNYTDFFQYPLIQGAPATDEPPRTHDHDSKLLETEHEKLKLEKEKRGCNNKLLQAKHEKLKLKKEKREEQISDVDIIEKLYISTQGALWRKNKDRLSWQTNNCTSEFKEANGRIAQINLKNNNLIGAVPKELGELSKLWRLDLNNNQLTGAVPKELGELKKLEKLNLGINQFTGKIPKELGELSKLWQLDLNNNQLTGKIPKELGELSKLWRLDLNNNQLTGKIPKELGELKYLMHLYLHENKLTGKIPKELGELSKLNELWLSGNQLTGKIPKELGELSKLNELWLSGNQLTGAVPKKLGELKNLIELDLNNNQLTGKIPKELGELKSLGYLNLSRNQLTGKIPKELGELKNLTHLYLHENKLTGAVPKELGELKNLTHLYLHENKLTGKIPKELGELSKLNELWLSGNQLTGAVPKELGELKSLTILSLHTNQLTGNPPIIPGCKINSEPEALTR